MKHFRLPLGFLAFWFIVTGKIVGYLNLLKLLGSFLLVLLGFCFFIIGPIFAVAFLIGLLTEGPPPKDYQ